LSCCSSGTISFSARICMRWRSVAIRSLVTCWMKAMTPAVKMAKTPRIRLLRRIERAGVRGLCMSVHLAQAAFGLCVAIGARRRVVIDGRSAEIHQQHREGDGVRVVAPHPDNVYQNTDPGTEDQPAPGAGGTGYRIGNDEEGAEHGSAPEQVKQRRAIAARAGTAPEQQAHQAQGTEHARWRVPADDLAPDQEQAS